MTDTLLVGAAKADITPPVGIDITGFCLRGLTRSRHRPLEVGALVFAAGEQQAALICCDLLNFTVASADVVRTEVAATLASTEAAVMLCCSHTHSAPALEAERKVGGAQEEWTELNETYRRMVSHQIVGAVREAAASLAPARVGVSRAGSARVAINRRVRLPDGTMIIGRSPDGPADRSVGVIRIDRLDGRPLASVIDYACHPITLGPESDAISPDYIGAVREVVEQATRAPALFIQGCAGDLAPVEGMGADPSIADHLGRVIGYEAAKLHEQIETKKIERREELVRSYNIIAAQVKEERPDPAPSVGVACRRLDLPLQPLPSADEAQRLDEEAERRVQHLRKQGAGEGELNIARVEHRWTSRLRRNLTEGDVATTTAGDVQALSVNNVLIVALPVEPFTRMGMKIRAALGQDVVVAGYANGTIAYCPLPENYPEGGYEVDRSYRLYGLPSPLAPDAAPQLIEAVCAVANEARSANGQRT